MKKLIILLCAIIILSSMVGCVKDKNNNEETFYFTGVIEQINEKTATVTPDEGEDIRRSGDKVNINLEENVEDFVEGDKIRVEYDGDVMESYPLQVNVISLEKIED